MKKIFTLFAAAMMAVSAMAEVKTIYSWESPEGTVSETGGTISYENGGTSSRLNYLNSTYYTICLNGKKANINDTNASDNAGHMKLVLSDGETFKSGDKIVLTAYYNKGEDKDVSAYIVFESGADVTSATVSHSSDIARGGSPEEITVTVPAEADGSKYLKMTRGAGGTNMFIIKLVVTRQTTALQNVEATSVKAGKKMVNGKLVIEKNGVTYNVFGQKM